MTRISQEEYEAVHRIFNYVEGLVGPYYGSKTIDETMELVSNNRWIMFPVKNVTSLREGVEYPTPNVFLAADAEEINDNGTGKISGNIGVTYHNVMSMAVLREKLKWKASKESLLQIVKGIPEDWNVEIVHKTKTDTNESTPQYDIFKSFKPSEVTMELLRSTIYDSDTHLLVKDDIYPKTGTPVLWSVTVLVVSKPVTLESFDIDAKQVFKVFFDLLT
jgi:hypothetical protein